MEKIKQVKVLDNYRLEIIFNDGVKGEIFLGDRLFGPVFEPLQDPIFFSKVQVDEFGAIAWPNGADLAPDAIYERLKN